MSVTLSVTIIVCTYRIIILFLENTILLSPLKGLLQIMNNKKRILILGASRLQLPGILKAREMGLIVGVVDQNPAAVGIPFSDVYYEVSTNDEKGVLKAAMNFCADAVMTLATDMPIRSVAYACDSLSLPGLSYDVAVRATDKGKMMEALKNSSIPVPWFIRIDSPDQIENKLIPSYPCISKPVDGSGSRGVVLIENAYNLVKSVAYSFSQGRGGGVIIEEYMSGPEVSCEIMVIHDSPHLIQITDKKTSGAPHFVEIAHNQPSTLPADIIQKIIKVSYDSINALDIDNGPVHAELIVTDEGPKIVEIGARMGGDFIATHLVPLSTGIDMTAATIRMALGENIDLKVRKHQGAAIMFLSGYSGQITKIKGVREAKRLPGIEELELYLDVGDKVRSLSNSNDRIGHIIAKADGADRAVMNCKDAFNKIQITIS